MPDSMHTTLRQYIDRIKSGHQSPWDQRLASAGRRLEHLARKMLNESPTLMGRDLVDLAPPFCGPVGVGVNHVSGLTPMEERFNADGRTQSRQPCPLPRLDTSTNRQVASSSSESSRGVGYRRCRSFTIRLGASHRVIRKGSTEWMTKKS